MILPAQPQPDLGSRHAQAAQQAMKAGDFEAAARAFGELTRLLPGVAEVHSNLGVAYFFNKQRVEAIQAFETALKIKPDLVSALIFSGIASFELSDYEQAAARLEKAVELKPDDPLAQVSLGLTYSAQLRFADAADRFEAATRLQPGNIDAWYGLGKARLDLANRKTRRLLEVAPGGARVLQLAGDIWRMRGDEKKAGILYEKSRDHSSSAQEDALYHEITELRQSGTRAFETIHKVAPASYRAHQVIADSLAAQQRGSEALSEYREVLRLKPDLVGIHKVIGDLLYIQGDREEALEEYRQDLNKRPNEADLHYRMGRTWAAMGDAQQAEKALRRSLELSATPPGAFKELAKIYLRRNDHKQGIELLKTYINTEGAGTDASAHYLLMGAYRAIGQTETAQIYAKKFQELSQSGNQQGGSLRQALSLFHDDDAGGSVP